MQTFLLLNPVHILKRAFVPKDKNLSLSKLSNDGAGCLVWTQKEAGRRSCAMARVRLGQGRVTAVPQLKQVMRQPECQCHLHCTVKDEQMLSLLG